MPKSFALLDLRDKIVDARMQSKGMQNPEVEGRTHHGWPPKGGSACGEGLGCSGRRNSYLPKEKARTKKRHKTSFCFGRAKTDRTPSQEMRDPQGTTKGERVIGAKEYAKSRFFCTERDLQGAQLHVIQSARQRKIIFFFLDTKEKKDREKV